MKNCLVYETLNRVSELLIEESKTPNTVRLSGVFGVAGVRNNNNRVYLKENYGKMVEALQEVIATEGCPGELEHPNSMNINLENVSHKIENIQMNEDGTVTGTILLLNTPKGKIAQALVEGGLPLFISSRGAGSIDENGNVTLSTIKTYDLVGTPGFSQAKLNLASNLTFESLNENLCVVYEAAEEVKPEEQKSKEFTEDVKTEDAQVEETKTEDKTDEVKSEEKTEADDKKASEKKDNDADKKSDADDKKAEEKKAEVDENEDNKNTDILKEDNMNEIKESLEALTNEVADLKAQLQEAKDALNDIQPVNYAAIEEWVKEEFAPEFKEDIVENVKDWTNNEFAPMVESWVCEEFAPEVQNWVCEEFAPEVQNWVCEEFAPEVQNWVCEEFAPEVQNWVCEEFAPEVQNWVCEEFAPVVDNWVCEEFGANVKSEVLESAKEWCKSDLANEIYENVNSFMESKSDERLKSIDEMLNVISGASSNEEAVKAVKESINDVYASNPVVAGMPNEYKPMWNLCTEAKKEEILGRAKVYDFTKKGVMEQFWSTVNFEEKKIDESAKTVVSQYSQFQNSTIANMKRLGFGRF